ncbi:protein obstructor-E-like [Oratosquilla oratoria]|uniref:protein obstructor-E-like n=1 Tax=Oratosquilla oratoria TaxID=337810 RepID=UPI003F76B974
MIQVALFALLVGLGSCQQRQQRQEEQPVYPRYPEVTYCEQDYGVQVYPHPTSCHQFTKCVNGTLTQEVCENGLLFDGKGADVYNHCNYYWAVNCEGREAEVVPIAETGCQYSFGLFSAGPCEDFYTKCEYGVPTDIPCTRGLAYDERIHTCNWADQMEYCDPEKLVGFKCPAYLDSRDPAYRFYPFPRFASDDCGSYIVCVNDLPRRVGCGDYQVFNKNTLGCDEPKNVPECANFRK